MKHVPEWFPGAGFQKKARLWRKFSEDMKTVPFEVVKQALVSSVLSLHIIVLRFSRNPERLSLVSPPRYWRNFPQKEIYLPRKRRSYRILAPPSMLGAQTRHVALIAISSININNEYV